METGSNGPLNGSTRVYGFDPAAPRHEVYALQYASSTVGNDILYWRSGLGHIPSGEPSHGAFLYFLIKGPSGNILYDEGVTPELAAKRPMVEQYQDHATVLARVGLTPKGIDGVIVSHSHWDHMNGIAVFPDAMHYIQEACFDWTMKTAPQYGMLRRLGVPLQEDAEWLLKLNYAGKVQIVNGERVGNPVPILPGIDVLRLDGHYVGLQAAIINTEKGMVVLAGDILNDYGNLTHDWPGGLCFTTLTDSLEAMQCLRELAKRGGIIIPGHDAVIMEQYPKVAPGVVRIA